MSRSVYDPPPSYVTCPQCHQQYDDSGYYGPDSHVCDPEARSRLRRIVEIYGAEQTRAMLDAVIANIEAEQQEERERLTRELRGRKERELQEAKERVTRLEKELEG